MRTYKKVVVSAGVVLAVALAMPLWAPFAVYGFLYAETILFGGRCGGSEVVHHIKRDSCIRDTSPVTAKNANTPVGSPAVCPLVLAVVYENNKAFAELLSKGAVPSRCAGYPQQFFDALSNCKYRPQAAEDFLSQFARAGIAAPDPAWLLSEQARLNCVPGMKFAVSLGADVNSIDSEGRAPLHYTTQDATEESINATAALVALGADAKRPAPNLEAPYALAKNRLGRFGNWPRLEAALLGRDPP